MLLVRAALTPIVLTVPRVGKRSSPRSSKAVFQRRSYCSNNRSCSAWRPTSTTLPHPSSSSDRPIAACNARHWKWRFGVMGRRCMLPVHLIYGVGVPHAGTYAPYATYSYGTEYMGPVYGRIMTCYEEWYTSKCIDVSIRGTDTWACSGQCPADRCPLDTELEALLAWIAAISVEEISLISCVLAGETDPRRNTFTRDCPRGNSRIWPIQ